MVKQYTIGIFRVDSYYGNGIHSGALHTDLVIVFHHPISLEELVGILFVNHYEPVYSIQDDDHLTVSKCRWQLLHA